MKKHVSGSSRARRRRQIARSPTRGGRAQKISVTVDEHVLRQVEQDAKREGHTLSAHVTEALARDVRRRRLATLIAEYESKHGAITETELSAIRKEWAD